MNRFRERGYSFPNLMKGRKKKTRLLFFTVFIHYDQNNQTERKHMEVKFCCKMYKNIHNAVPKENKKIML